MILKRTRIWDFASNKPFIIYPLSDSLNYNYVVGY